MQFITIEQRSPEWLEWRKNLITSSEVPAIMGVSPWSNKHQLWNIKKGLYKIPDNKFMKRGRELEDEARDKASELLEDIFTPACLQRENHGCSLDGINFDNSIILEIKCPTGYIDHDIAKEDQIPEKYYWQLMHQMFVTGLDNCVYFSYKSDKDWAFVELERDEQAIKEMLKECDDFYDSLSLRENPYDDPNYREVIDDDLIGLDEELYKLMTRISEDEKRIKEIKESLKLNISKNTESKHFKYTVSETKGSIDYKKLEKEELIDLEKYRRPSTESLRITMKS